MLTCKTFRSVIESMWRFYSQRRKRQFLVPLLVRIGSSGGVAAASRGSIKSRVGTSAHLLMRLNNTEMVSVAKTERGQQQPQRDRASAFSTFHIDSESTILSGIRPPGRDWKWVFEATVPLKNIERYFGSEARSQGQRYNSSNSASLIDEVNAGSSANDRSVGLVVKHHRDNSQQGQRGHRGQQQQQQAGSLVIMGDFLMGTSHGSAFLVRELDEFIVGKVENEGTNGLVGSKLANGEVYLGNMFNSRYSGYGQHQTPDGGIYEGSFASYVAPDNNAPPANAANVPPANVPPANTPQGTTPANVGLGKKKGYGAMLKSNSTIYRGNWANGLYNGWGVEVSKNGVVSHGTWIDGKLSGPAVRIFPDGRYYSGDWDAGKKVGRGTFMWPNGTTYVGEWRNGLRHGLGKISWRNQREDYFFEGTWENDLPLIHRHNTVSSNIILSVDDDDIIPYNRYFALPIDSWETLYRNNVSRYVLGLGLGMTGCCRYIN